MYANSEQLRQHEAHKARRSMWFAKPKPQQSSVLAITAPKLTVVEDTQRPIRDERDHVDRWRSWMAKPLRMYIVTRSAELGSSYDQVIGTSRKAFVVSVRHQIMWEIKNHVKPTISYPEIGRLFERDHTTILSGVRRHSKIRASILENEESVSKRHIEILLTLDIKEKSTELRDRISLKNRGFIKFDFKLMRNVLTEQGKSYVNMVQRMTEMASTLPKPSTE